MAARMFEALYRECHPPIVISGPRGPAQCRVVPVTFAQSLATIKMFNPLGVPHDYPNC